MFHLRSKEVTGQYISYSAQYCYIALFIRVISKVVYLLFDVKAVKPFVEGTLKPQGTKIIGLIKQGCTIQFSNDIYVLRIHGHYNKPV